MTETHIFLPAIRKTTGGVAVLLRLGAFLHAAGFPVRFVPREPVALPEFAAAVPVTPWAEARPAAGDLWLVPEGWPNALAPGLKAGARGLVYVQNWAYLFSALPEGLDWRDLGVAFLAVSDPVRLFIRESLGLEAPVLRPAIDLGLFVPPAAKPAGPPWRVAFMPRKNKAEAAAIRDILTARRRGQSPVHWVAVEDMSQTEVAAALASAHVFLATGFPEGCPLPPLEAMACGCLCAGYAGFGGFDSMRQAVDLPFLARPWFPLRQVPWGGNGLWTADASPLAAALALDTALGWLERGAPEAARTVAAAVETARAYGLEEMRRAVVALWTEMAGG